MTKFDKLVKIRNRASRFLKYPVCLSQRNGRMENSLHHQLKEHFREPGSEIEVKIGRYRIDVVNGRRLVEIQRSGLASIRDKIAILLREHPVDVVKPLVVRKRLVKLNRKGGKVVSQRWSPRRGSMLDLFDELLYFTRVFPNPNLRLIAATIDIEELRFPGHGRRRRRRDGDFQVEDRRLTELHETQVFQSAGDLHRLLPNDLPSPFHTGQLAEGLEIRRWQAQRIAYVLRKTGAAKAVGKQGNAHLYRLCRPKKATSRKARSAASQSKSSRKKAVRKSTPSLRQKAG